MIFYGSEFYVLERCDVTEESIAKTLGEVIEEYQNTYFKGNKGDLAKLDARWCIFYSKENVPMYFYCFTFVEFDDQDHLNHFKIKNPDLYNHLIDTGFSIKIADIESRM